MQIEAKRFLTLKMHRSIFLYRLTVSIIRIGSVKKTVQRCWIPTADSENLSHEFLSADVVRGRRGSCAGAVIYGRINQEHSSGLLSFVRRRYDRTADGEIGFFSPVSTSLLLSHLLGNLDLLQRRRVKSHQTLFLS